MALKAAFISEAPQLGVVKFQSGNSKVVVNLRFEIEKCRKWELCCRLGGLAQRGTTPVGDDKKPTVAGGAESSSVSIDGVQENESKGFLSLLPTEGISSVLKCILS